MAHSHATASQIEEQAAFGLSLLTVLGLAAGMAGQMGRGRMGRARGSGWALPIWRAGCRRGPRPWRRWCGSASWTLTC